MGEYNGDAVHQLELAQRTIEYVLAIIIPVLLAVMLYSYYLFSDWFQIIFVITLAVAGLMVLPAKRALNLHYTTWSRNTMPQKMITSVVGMIYISTASVFGVSIMSAAKGFDPEQPMTFLTVASLLLALIGIMAYSSKNRERFEHMDIRFYRRSAEHVESSVKEFLISRTESYKKVTKGRRTTLGLLDRGIMINIAAQPGNSTEVIIECSDPKDAEMCDALKRALDRTT